MMPKVSIIIPTYNRSHFLCTALDSALLQDYGNIEVIISDNASTDNTPEIIAKYLGDPRIKYFRNEKNIGMYPNQRRALFEYASGDWALMLDDDDYLIDKSYISDAMTLLNKNRYIVIIHANCRMLHDPSGSYKETDKQLPEIVDGRWMFLNYKYAVIGNTNYDKLTVLFDRKKALELNFFNDIINSSDRDSLLKLSLKGHIGFIDKVVSVYRIHGSNASASIDINGYFENLRAVTSPYEYAKKLKIFEEKQLDKWKKRMIRESAAIVFIGSLLRSDKGFTNKFISRLYREYPFALTIILDIFKPKIFAKIMLSKLRSISPGSN